MFNWDKLDRYFWILFVGLVVYDLVKSGTDGMIEMFTDPVFYVIIIFLVLFILITLFILSKISPKSE